MLKTNRFIWPARLAWAAGHRRYKCWRCCCGTFPLLPVGLPLLFYPFILSLCTVVVDVENLGLGFTTRKVFIQEKAIFFLMSNKLTTMTPV